MSPGLSFELMKNTDLDGEISELDISTWYWKLFNISQLLKILPSSGVAEMSKVFPISENVDSKEVCPPPEDDSFICADDLAKLAFIFTIIFYTSIIVS